MQRKVICHESHKERYRNSAWFNRLLRSWEINFAPSKPSVYYWYGLRVLEGLQNLLYYGFYLRRWTFQTPFWAKEIPWVKGKILRGVNCPCAWLFTWLKNHLQRLKAWEYFAWPRWLHYVSWFRSCKNFRHWRLRRPKFLLRYSWVFGSRNDYWFWAWSFTWLVGTWNSYLRNDNRDSSLLQLEQALDVLLDSTRSNKMACERET